MSAASNSYLEAACSTACNQRRLIDALRDLLGLYYQPDEPADHRARQIALFVKDLADQSDDAVHWAIDEWRRNHDRRPTPASLRQLAMMRRQEAFAVRKSRGAQQVRYREDEPVCVQPDPERRAAFLAEIERTIAELGAKVDAEAAAQRRPHWTETAAPDDPRWEQLHRARAANPLMSP